MEIGRFCISYLKNARLWSCVFCFFKNPNVYEEENIYSVILEIIFSKNEPLTLSLALLHLVNLNDQQGAADFH